MNSFDVFVIKGFTVYNIENYLCLIIYNIENYLCLIKIDENLPITSLDVELKTSSL